MSEQIYSKKQALGYIANALFKGGIPHSDLKEIMARANYNIERDQVMRFGPVLMTYFFRYVVMLGT